MKSKRLSNNSVALCHYYTEFSSDKEIIEGISIFTSELTNGDIYISPKQITLTKTELKNLRDFINEILNEENEERKDV